MNYSNAGYDYGVNPFMILLGDMEFSDLFLKAECVGILYISGMDEAHEMTPVEIAFLFLNEKQAEELFECLLGWIEKSNGDGDAVAIGFIENIKGGYNVAISPEIEHLIDRLTPDNFKNRITPIAVAQTHYKKIDNIGGNYLTFKNNLHKAAKVRIGYAVGNPKDINNIKQGRKSFFKTKFCFAVENDRSELSKGYSIAVASKKKFNPKALSKGPSDSRHNISKRRIKRIQEFLPITYSKLTNKWLELIQTKLSSKYDLDLVMQAICNITMFERIKSTRELTLDFAKPGFATDILAYLTTSYESFDSYYPADSFYTEERVVKQIENDKRELETFLNK